MTLPVFPNAISINDLRTETGQTTGSLGAYRAGAGIVPAGVFGAPNGVATKVPTSGPLTLNDFHGYPVNMPGSTILNWFWNNRTALYRSAVTTNFADQGPGANASPTTWPGDAADNGAHYNSFNTLTGTLNWGFATPGDVSSIYSEYWTYITIQTGFNRNNNSSIGDLSGVSAFSNNYWNQSYTNIGRVVVVKSLSATVPNPSFSQFVVWNNWDNSDNLGGSWSAIAIPGRWGIASQTNVGTSFTLPRAQFCISQNNWKPGGSYNNTMASYSCSLGTRFYNNNPWWRNNIHLFMINTTTSDIGVSQSNQPLQGTALVTFFYNLDNNT